MICGYHEYISKLLFEGELDLLTLRGPRANISASAQASEQTVIAKNPSLYQNISITTLLTAKLW